MTLSATETAILALIATLNASADLPAARRNPVFSDVFELLAEKPEIGRALIVRTGDPVDTQRTIGLPSDEHFEIVRAVEVEFYLGGPEGDDLFAQFDAGMLAIFAAIEADPTLGGVVTRAEIAEQPEIGEDEAGSNAVLTALIRVQLTYLSSRAY
jgi:hypothetical protein